MLAAWPSVGAAHPSRREDKELFRFMQSVFSCTVHTVASYSTTYKLTSRSLATMVLSGPPVIAAVTTSAIGLCVCVCVRACVCVCVKAFTH